eukprot:gene4401-4448_t
MAVPNIERMVRIWGVILNMADGTSYEVHYTKKIVLNAVNAYVWRRGVTGQKKLWVAVAIVIAVNAAFPGINGLFLPQIEIFVSLLPFTFLAVMWLAHYRNTVGKFDSMVRRSANILIGDDQLSLSSDLGSTQIPWARITEIWEMPDLWMLFLAPNSFFCIPTGTISPADLDRVRTLVSISGMTERPARPGSVQAGTRT